MDQGASQAAVTDRSRSAELLGRDPGRGAKQAIIGPAVLAE